MNKTLNISFPRSGHHLLVRCLGDYFGEKFTYCEFYKARRFCHCGKIPCKTGSLFQKNHDKPLNISKSYNLKYVILYRKPIPSFMSLYELKVKNNKFKKDCYHTWENFILNFAIPYYKKWKNKWVKDSKPKGKLIITYEDLIEKSSSTISKVIKLINSNKEIKSKRLKKVIKDRNIKYRRKINNFKYYNKDFIVNIEQKLK